MKITNFSYRKKLIAFGLVIGVLPITVLGIFSYFKSSSIMQAKINDANNQALQQTETSVEEVLKSIQYYYFVVANSPTVTDYLDKRLTYIDYDSVVGIQRRLLGAQSVQASVKSAFYANFNYDWVIGTEGMSSLNNKFNMEQVNKIVKDPRNSFWICNEKDANMFVQNESDSYKAIDNISLVIKLPLNSNEPEGALFVNLQGDEFRKSAVQSGRLDEMIILDSNYNVILKDGQSILSDKSNNLLESQLKERTNQKGFYKSKIDNNSVVISYRKSKYTGWTYVSIYNIEDITKNSRSIGWVTLWLCLFIVLCVFLISVLGSSVIYTPIRNVYDIIKKNVDIIANVKNKDEFTYIGEGINNLFTMQTKMVEQIESQVVQIEELFLIKLVNGEMDKNEIDLKLKALGYNEFWKCLGILSVQIDSLDNTKYNENDRDLLLFGVSNIIYEVLNSSIIFMPTLIQKSQVVLIGGNQQTHEEFKEFAYTCATTIQANVKKYLEFSVSVGVSRPFHDLYDAQIAYKESIEALMCCIRFGEETIHYFEDVQPNGQIKRIYPRNIEDDLIYAINQGDAGKAEELLDKIIDNFFSKELSFSEYQVSLTRLLINIIGVLQDSGESIDIIFGKRHRLFDELYRLRNTPQIKKWFKVSVINPVIQCLDERRGSHFKHILDEIINIIHNEYDTDLSLESCAARLNYHSNYIWRILKKEMDITFSEYLLQYRLSMAKKWLEETNMSVGEIAERLRYNNSQNFIRYFKKLEGITPGQYRDRYKSNMLKSLT